MSPVFAVRGALKMYRPNELSGTARRDAENGWTGRITIVGGCGHVGLPLGMAFAKAGLRVDLLDTWADRVNQVNQGRMPFKEDGADELLPKLIESGLLRATSDPEVISQAEG